MMKTMQMRLATMAIIVAIAMAGAGCVTTRISGKVVNCANSKPLGSVSITMVEADKDPKKAVVTANYYYGTTNADGTYAMSGYGDPAKTYWTAEMAKEGFISGGARFEPGSPPQDVCLNPEPKDAPKDPAKKKPKKKK